MSLEMERKVAIEAVRAASAVCRAVQQGLAAGSTLTKSDRSPVTVADFGAQAVASTMLQRAFPADPLVAEEDAGELRGARNPALLGRLLDAVRPVLPGMGRAELLDAIDRGSHPGGAGGRWWTLDPVDGTRGFLRMDQYAVALALVEEGRVRLGVLGCPNLPVDPEDPGAGRGCLLVAVEGQGSFQVPLDGGRERRLRVDGLADPGAARFCESVESAHSSRSDSVRVARELGIARPPFRIDSQCKYAAVARGEASIYLRLPTSRDYVEKIWDHAAGWCVVTEAGGRVTDVRGRPLDFSAGRRLERNRGVVATNGLLHERTIQALARVLES